MAVESELLPEGKNILAEMDELSNDDEWIHFNDSLNGTEYSCLCPCCGEIVLCEEKKSCNMRECPMCGTMMIRN